MIESGELARGVSPAAAQRDAAQRALWARTAVVAGRLNRAHGELVAIAAELLDGKHWGDGGFRSAEHYLVVRAGLSPAHARDVVALARRRVELPAASEALTAGLLSLDQVAVVAHHVPASYQQSVTDLARHATVPQLRRAVSRHAFAVPDPAQVGQAASGADQSTAEQSESERRACARPELTMQYDRDGRFQLRYSAPATVGALVEQALKEARDALFLGRTDGAEASRPGEAQRGEAFRPREQPTQADALEEFRQRL